ncbi:MAG: alpha-amylase family glycosyl hydrolase [Chitinophagaceae bacterium]
MATKFPTVSWASNAVMYEANVRQYSKEGNFNTFQQHLPRLQQMGVSIIWLMPITPISYALRQGSLGSYYACSSYTKINPEFGTENDFKSLVNTAHQLGMKVIIDWVANHTGADHEWTINHKDFYILDEAGNFTERNGWHDVIDLNYNNAAMQDAMISAMQYWITNFDIDGFRCDMAHLVPLNFWQKARTACDVLKPLYWLAECEETEYHQVFDTTYAWALMHGWDSYAKHQTNIHAIYNILHGYSQYPNGAKKLLFTSNHDENSWNGTEYEKYGTKTKALAVFSFTWDGVPLIYSGQETANKKRLKFFDKDEIEWKNDDLPLEKFYTTLSHLHQSKAICLGETFNLPTPQDYVMAFLRKFEDEVVLVVLNLSNHDRVHLVVKHNWLHGTFTNIFSGLEFDFKGSETFELMANDYLVYHKK